ncbi:hypothetical protein HY622_01220 [Candidatus Uhrbacteria bacterium]|nr:hypothetical protein [Candidatus Uhrbacteria bacterium]
MRFFIFLGALIVGLALLAGSQLYALSIDRLSGRILLQVESKGEAWYVDPGSRQRVSLGRPADAFQAMRSFGIGITNADLDRIATVDEQQEGDEKIASRLAGKIVLQVQSKGEAWYINPVNLRRYFLGRPADAFSVMRNLGLGIANKDIKAVPEYGTQEQTRQPSSLSTPSGQQETKQETKPKTDSSKQQAADGKRLSGSYRCWSYNVSGGGGGDCRLFAPIVLNADGTYSMSSEKGTYRIDGTTIYLSESKIRGPGTLSADGLQIRFEYDYNSWHHVITYLKEGGSASSQLEGGAEVPVYMILEYPSKSSSLGTIATVELVPEGQKVETASYKPTAIPVWDGDKKVTASFHKGTNQPKTGQKYTVYTNYGREATAVGTLDLTKVTKEITVTINVSTGKAEQEAVERPEGPEIVVEIDLVYPSRDSSLGSIQTITLVPEGQDPTTAVYKPMALAVWDSDKTVVGSFHKATNQVKTKAKYDVYADWGAFGGYVKSGTLDLTSTTEGPVKKILQTTIAGSSQSSATAQPSEAPTQQNQSGASSPTTATPTYVSVELTLQYAAGDQSLHNVTKILLRSQEKIPAYEGSSTLLYEEKEGLAGYGTTQQQLVATLSSVKAGIAYDVFVTSYTIGEKKVGSLDMRGVATDTKKTISVQ